MDPNKYGRIALPALSSSRRPYVRTDGRPRGRRWLRRHGMLPKPPARLRSLPRVKQETAARRRVRWLRWT